MDGRWLRGAVGAGVILFAGCASARVDDAHAPRWVGLTTTTFRNTTHDSGLPTTATSTAFAQDGRGFMWIGFQDGLMRWDGYRYRRYVGDPTQAGALPDGYITALHADPRGRLWVGTNVGGLSLFDSKHDRFVAYGGADLRQSPIVSIVDDGAGGLWIGSSAGLHHLDPTSGRARLTPLAKAGAVTSLAADASGVLWVGAANGLWRRAPSGDFAKITLPSGSGPVRLSALSLDSAGNLWVGSTQNGAFLIRRGSDSPTRVVGAQVGGLDLGAEGVISIAEVRPGEVWLGSGGQGIVVVDVATLSARRVRHDPSVGASLSDDTVTAIVRDRSGLVWVATNRGFSIYNPQPSAFAAIMGPSRAPPRLEDGDVRCVEVTTDGHVWLGLGSNGVDVFDPERGRVARLAADGAHPTRALAPARIQAIKAVPGGAVYIGGDRGLYRTDLTARAVERVAIGGRNAAAPARFLDYHDGVLWIDQEGLYGVRLDARGSPPGEILNIAGRLRPARVAAMAAGPAGSLWIGTHNGLERIDRQRVVETILSDATDPHGLIPGGLTSLLIDRRGRLWASSTGGGIAILMGRDAKGRPRFQRLGVRQGLPNANVDDLLLAADGAIWASTDDGLARIDPETLIVSPFGEADGVALGNYWAGTGVATTKGELLFGAVGGLTIVKPDQLARWNYQPPMVITRLDVAGSPTLSSATGGSEAGLKLGPNSNGVSVEFAALDYSAPALNRYAYRLIGYDRDWIETDATRRIAHYTNLAPGRYTLQLRGSNRAGLWSSRPLELRLSVAPGWWQTLWFRASVILAAAGLIALLLYARTGVLRRRQRQLEQLVVNRTEDLRATQRELEKMAYSDVLTGLANRRMSSENCRRLIADARRSGRGFAMLLIDLDRFKSINDQLGHDAGDALLIEVGARLQRTARENDYSARLGGDEFAILLSDIRPGGGVCEAVCQRLIQSFEPPVMFGDEPIVTSISIGVAFFPEDGDTEERLYKSADIALYEAKRGGRNTWRLHRTTASAKALIEPPPASRDQGSVAA